VDRPRCDVFRLAEGPTVFVADVRREELDRCVGDELAERVGAVVEL
jgi:hypothetical protein